MLFSPLGRLKKINLLNTGYPVAVDFGVSALKVLHVAPGEGDQGLKLVCAAMVETPDDIAGDHAKRIAFQAAELVKLSKQLELRGKRAVCGIPAVQTFCKHMQFPKSDSTPVAALVKAAVPAQVGCHPDALLYRHVEVPATGISGKNEVICLAASRDLVTRLMNALSAAKLEPVGIHPEFHAMLRAFTVGVAAGNQETDGATLYLDLGAGATKVVIAHGPAMVFAKTVTVGGRHMDQALSRGLKCSVAEARAKRLAAKALTPSTPAHAPRPAEGADAGGGMAMLSAAMAKHEGRGEGASGAGAAVATRPGAHADEIDLSAQLETLTDEVAMCLRYHESLFPGKRVGRAVLVGGEARHRGLCQAVARAIRLPTQIADPLARVARTGAEPCIGTILIGPQPGWTVPLGLCVSPTDL